jgi:archaeosine synthase
MYLSGVATPRNAATLVYAGVDLLDAKLAKVKGRQGKYLTREGEYFLEDLDELPCSCPVCADHRTDPSDFDRADCAAHNVAVLESELATVRRRIRDGRLRDYVEGQARHEQWLTAAFREFDQQYGYVEERTPVLRNNELSAASSDTLRRAEIQRFAERVTTRYRSRFDEPLVLVPCSARKPYSESQSHSQFQDAIQYRAHLASMTSPIGVVPQELELTYPAQHYDTVVTGRWSEDEKRFVADVLLRYLQRNDYPRVVAHVPDEGYRDICERVEGEVDVPFEYTVEDHPTTTDSLANLMSTLEGGLKFSRRERQHNTVKAIADYQFGDGAGDELFADVDLQTTSRYPKLQLRDADDEQLATMVPNYGTLSFTLAGGRVWRDSDAPTKRVEIDGFVPHGSVLAPGVVDADEEIRVGDEVIIEGPRAFGVGRAEMFGREMAESTRGEAVSVRHVEEL